jgi:endonuclease YncB( thermonuclease family)
MRCSRCGTDNPSGAGFCRECGAPFSKKSRSGGKRVGIGCGVIVGLLVVAGVVGAVLDRTKGDDQTGTGSVAAEPTANEMSALVTKSPTPRPTPTESRTRAQVVSVLDGDTIEVSVNGKNRQVQYLGVAAPGSGERFEQECFNQNKGLVEGKTVDLVADGPDTDAAGRLLRYVWVDSKFVNFELIRWGFARYEPSSPNLRYDKMLTDGQNMAMWESQGFWLPRRLATGVFERLDSGQGMGELTIDNGNEGDAVIVLSQSGKTVVKTYIRGKDSCTITGIADGTYDVFFTTGTDWDGSVFTRDADFQKFEDPLEYSTTSSSYTTWSLTLHTVIGGTAQTDEVDPNAFPK